MVVMVVLPLVIPPQPVPMGGVENVSLVSLLLLLPLPSSLPSSLPFLAWVEVAATRRALVFGGTLEPLVRRRDRAPRPSSWPGRPQ